VSPEVEPDSEPPGDFPGEASSTPAELLVGDAEAGQRLDVFLAARFPLYSRVQLRRCILAHAVTVDGRDMRSSFRLQPGHRVSVSLPQPPQEGPVPENIPLAILYEDESLAVIEKPPGMVVHPAKGHWSGTLTAALAYHFQNLSTAGGPTRPGVVHRLDRDTSGVIAIAKTDRAHLALAAQFEERTVEKEYLAIVAGRFDHDRDIIDAPIGPHPYQREKMAIRAGHSSSRPAQTFYEVTERFGGFAALRVLPKTGRTHQIRVHCAHVGCPVLCDRLYGGRAQITRKELIGARSGGSHSSSPLPSPGGSDDEVLLERQALHARRLRIRHPIDRRWLEFESSIPADMQQVLETLRANKR
jgi:23S rRNA pseudouridine1911/1915/1917 synthase